MNDPAVSVVIPTLGRAADLERCLDSLSKQVYRAFEIIIVTNDKYGLKYLIQRYSDLHIDIVAQEAKGLSHARNAGLFSAKGKIVSFIDDDVVVSDAWVQEVTNTFNKSTDIGGVSGPTIIPPEIAINRDILAFHSKIKCNIGWRLLGKIYNYFILENKPYAIGRILKSGGFSLGPNYAESVDSSGETEADYLEACNMSFRKDILDKTGGFSLEYKGIGDWSEPDLSFRVRQEGYRLVFNPKAIVTHFISQQGVYGERGKDSYQRIKNFIHFYYKWIKPNTFDKAIRFGFNLLFINLYWVYKFVLTGNPNWLSGISGTFSGLKGEICKS